MFHVRPNGTDTLYKFHQVGSGLDIRNKLDKHGITNRVMIIPPGQPDKVGFDVVIPDVGNKMSDRVKQYANNNKVKLESSRGYFKVIGSQDQAKARDIMRGQIVKGEHGDNNAIA